MKPQILNSNYALRLSINTLITPRLYDDRYKPSETAGLAKSEADLASASKREAGSHGEYERTPVSGGVRILLRCGRRVFRGA